MKQGQKFNQKVSFLKNESGQAVVEYVLLGIVVVTIIMMLGRVFKTLDDGFNQYMGGYIACLMEFGELPSLGVSESDLKKHISGNGKKCDAKFGEFTLADGRPPRSSSGSGSGSNSASNRSGSNYGDSSGRSDQASNGGSSSEGDGDGSDKDSRSGTGSLRKGGGGSGGRGAGKGQASTSPYGTLDGASSFDQNKTIIVENEDADEDAAKKEKNKRRRTPNFSTRSREPYKAIGGRLQQEFEKQQSKRPIARRPSTTVIVLKTEDRSTPTKVPIKPPKPKEFEAKDMNDSGNGFSFGNILRWLLIAGMVIAIVIFFGGQVLNYSNSQD